MTTVMTGNAIREALEPFAKVAEWLDDTWQDDETDWPEALDANSNAPERPTVGDLRRARAAGKADRDAVRRAIYLAFQFKNFGHENNVGDFNYSTGELAAFEATVEEATDRVLSCLSPVAAEEADASRTPCERCQGNGEIVTDWDRYRHPHEGDVGDEAVAECPDCSGEGTHTAAGAVPADVRALVIAARNVAFDAAPSPEALKALDDASEVFAARVPWEDVS